LEELTVRESVQGGEINLIKVKVQALATFTKEKETEKKDREGHRKKARDARRRKIIRIIVSQSFD